MSENRPSNVKLPWEKTAVLEMRKQGGLWLLEIEIAVKRDN